MVLAAIRLGGNSLRNRTPFSSTTGPIMPCLFLSHGGACNQVGPSADENGRLQVADYANCGFGSSSVPASSAAAAAATSEDGGVAGQPPLPATAVEVESTVLEHFPQEQREDAPFPTKVSSGPQIGFYKFLHMLSDYGHFFSPSHA